MIQLLELKKKILTAPQESGVYLMKDHCGRVLYVGKAKLLKKRLLNYFGGNLDSKTQALMAKVADIEYRLAPNEAMALLLEFKLIHEFSPRYNISLKDDKSFPFVRISKEIFPQIQVARQKINPGFRYLGPYTNTKLLKSALKIIRLKFPYRSCLRLPKRSCVYHRINLCPAPCIGKISRQEYQQLIDDIILILEGKAELLIRKLAAAMQERSRATEFEAAARIRDQISVLSRIAGQSDGSTRTPGWPDELTGKNELELLQKTLKLKTLPARIEGFDISNLSGQQAVGSMVSFHRAKPDKSSYRRFRIKSFSGIDDYKMLAEVVRRRYTRLLQEQKSLPDLLLIDGGRGHILTAATQLWALGLHIPLVSIAKPRKRGRGKETIYSISQPPKTAIVLIKEGPALNLIRRIRDEAHRFALAYHHLLRKKAFIAE